MEESTFVGSAEVPASANHTCDDEVRLGSSEVQDADSQLVCNNETVTEAVTSAVMLTADTTEDTELVDTGALQASGATAEANDGHEGVPIVPGDTNGTTSDSQHADIMEQPPVNGNGNIQQSDEEKMPDLNNSSPANHELELAMNQAKQKFGAFQQLDNPASVVIDLRNPPLVQVCLLHGEDDVGAGGSGSSTGVHRRPQTARRGRRFHSSTTDRTTVEGVLLDSHTSNKDVLSSVTDAPSNQLAADDGKKSPKKDEKATAELSTIIHLKVVDTAADAIRSVQSEHSPVPANVVSDCHVRLHRHPDADENSESSDDGTMRVHSVNRTYSRNPSVPAARKNPPQTTIAKSADYHDGKRSSEVLPDTGTISRRTQVFKPKRSGQQQTRIGPAWFSRRSLDAPPPEIWKCARMSKTLKTMKRPNYNSGVRHLPMVAVPPLVKQVLEVPVSEEADISAIGREELKLWRLSEEDVEELQSQLHQEAEHRRSEHIMPLVMQMTDAQIEHAYEHVAESMKTYEIVEADSDEDMAEDEEGEEETADDYENSNHLKSPDWTGSNEIGPEKFGETEYSRLRPKRHAVDYGPSAFAPILIMEGRRVFSQQRKLSKGSQTKTTDTADRVKLQRHSQGHKSHRRRRRKSKLTDQLDDEPVKTSVEKCTNDTDDVAGYFYFNYCRHTELCKRFYIMVE